MYTSGSSFINWNKRRSAEGLPQRLTDWQLLNVATWKHVKSNAYFNRPDNIKEKNDMIGEEAR